MAKAIIKRSGEMQNDLCGKRLDGNFHERCDTPLISSTTDGCWLFEQMEGNVRSMVPHADNSVYLSILHPAGDPVTAANKDSVREFLRTTFFDNAAALECQLAAICSTLRGVTTVRAFITVGPGGVGQSLNTLPHREPVRWQSRFHGRNSWMCSILEDEHQKQADTFTGKVNVRGVIFTTLDMKTLDVLFFRSNTVCSSGRHHRPGGPSAKTFTRRW